VGENKLRNFGISNPVQSLSGVVENSNGLQSKPKGALMAQIFISHSAKDRRIIEFINRAFASTKVAAKYEEIEAILEGRRTAQQIKGDIGISNAVFILLGET
jgi:hypothetical protein